MPGGGISKDGSPCSDRQTTRKDVRAVFLMLWWARCEASPDEGSHEGVGQPLLGFHSTRRPRAPTLFIAQDRLQRNILSMLMVERMTPSDIPEVFTRRGDHKAGEGARRIGLWSLRHCQSVVGWHGHLKRLANQRVWEVALLEWKGRANCSIAARRLAPLQPSRVVPRCGQLVAKCICVGTMVLPSTRNGFGNRPHYQHGPGCAFGGAKAATMFRSLDPRTICTV